MKLKFRKQFTLTAREGTIAEIDKIKRTNDCGSGVKVRVVNLWKQPKWFDLGWFVEAGKTVSLKSGDE